MVSHVIENQVGCALAFASSSSPDAMRTHWEGIRPYFGLHVEKSVEEVAGFGRNRPRSASKLHFASETSMRITLQYCYTR